MTSRRFRAPLARKGIALLGLLALGACATPPAADTVYEGALVWGDTGFAPGTLAVREGRIVDRYSVGETTRAVDVAGAFITPPLANAHQHLTFAGGGADWPFLEAGVYYVWNPNILASLLDEDYLAYFAQAGTIDLKTSAGGITEPGSHPEPLYVDQLGPTVYGGMGYDELYRDAFHYGRTEAEIVETLDRLVAQGADFVKIYLLGSEGYEPPAADDEPRSTTGLDPDNVAFLVREAHARDLPVAAHLETRADFRVAAEAGVDMAAHLPAYGGVTPERAATRTLTEADIAAARAAGMAVVPTYALGGYRTEQAVEEAPDDGAAQAALEATRQVQSANLSALHAAGVPVLLGTDLGPGLVGMEMARWVALGAMTREEVLASAFATGPALFPERRIGCLEAGCEADFLVLDADPREDLDAFEAIRLRIKAGRERVASDGRD